MIIIPQSPDEHDLLWRRREALRYVLGESAEIEVRCARGLPLRTLQASFRERLNNLHRWLDDPLTG